MCGDTVSLRRECECLCVVTYLFVSAWSTYHRAYITRHTTTMRHNSPLPHILQAILLNQSAQSMKCPASLESTNTLLILTLEEQSHFRPRCPIGFSLSNRLTFISFRLCCAGDTIYRLACRNWRAVDVGLNTLMSSLHRLARERGTRLVVCHCSWRKIGDCSEEMESGDLFLCRNGSGMPLMEAIGVESLG